MAGQGEQDSNEQTAWEEVVSGKRLPVAGQWADEEAESVRQALLWRQAREQTAMITPEQAAAFYQRTEQLRRERLRPTRGKTIGLLALAGLGLLGLGLGLGWWLSHSEPVSTPRVTAISSGSPMLPPATPRPICHK